MYSRKIMTMIRADSINKLKYNAHLENRSLILLVSLDVDLLGKLNDWFKLRVLLSLHEASQ